MAWKIKVTKTAAKQLKKIDKIVQRRIFDFLKNKLEPTGNPRQYGKALRGKKGELWRFRVGDYRLICSIEDKTLTILVLALGHRKKVYR